MPTYAIVIVVLVSSGVVWFLTNMLREVRRLRPIAAPLIDRARAHRELGKLADRPLSELFMEARSGNAAAQYRLGTLYAEGHGLPHDEAKAVAWYEQAAASNFVEAQYCLGLHYQHGRGVKQNCEQARSWYERAAIAGEPAAQCNLGVLFLTGSGVERSLINAAYWLVAAAAQKNTQATENLEWLKEHSDEISAEDRLSLLKFERQANKGDLAAVLLLGWVNEVGLGVPENKQRARQHYEDAQSKGHLFAHNLLNRL